MALTHAERRAVAPVGQLEPGAPGPRFRVTGTTAGYVNRRSMDIQEELLLAGHTPASLGDDWGAEPAERWGRVCRGDAAESGAHGARRLGHLLPGVRDAPSAGLGPLPVEPRDAVASMTVLDAARRSATEGVVSRSADQDAGHASGAGRHLCRPAPLACPKIRRSAP